MNKKNILIVCVLAVLVSLIIVVINGVTAKPTGLPLSLQTVRNLKEGSLSHEVRNGKIMVTVVDKSGDCHVHILHHSEVSQQEALLVLSQKQAELLKQ